MKSISISRFLIVVGCLVSTYLGSPFCLAQGTGTTPDPAKIAVAELGGTRNVHVCGDLFCAGQFSSEDIAKIKAAGVVCVITLRADGEIKWDEKSAIEKAGMDFVKVSFREPESLTDDVFDEVRKLLKSNQKATLLHCGSANRVGGVWLPYRVLDQGVPLETALREAKQIGLNNSGYEQRALDYIQRQQQRDPKKTDDDTQEDKSETSIRPGINDRFLDPDLNVDDFVKRFEIESREVYASRNQVLRACGVKPGWYVADIGAGTGVYTRLFSPTVGSQGWVYAVDISSRFVEHINSMSKSENLSNVTAVLCTDNSIKLPPNSVDLAFVCDTYHHFEFPKSTVTSIYNAVKPGGEFVVIDFERIPGKSREWILGHVRAGKDTFRGEIESCGFQFVGQIEIPGFEENYFLRFRKN